MRAKDSERSEYNIHQFIRRSVIFFKRKLEKLDIYDIWDYSSEVGYYYA
jgi:hypothetical protein